MVFITGNFKGMPINGHALPSVPDKYQAAKLLIAKEMILIIEELDKYYYRDQPTAERVAGYALKLLVAHRNWESKKIVSKTVYYFKLKLK